MKHFSAVFITLMCIITYIPGLISSQAYAEEITLTFSEAVAIGLRDNKDILFKIQDLEKAKLKIAEAEGELFPSLAYAGSWFYTAGLYNKDLSQTNSQITIKQYLYKGGSVINNIKYNGYKLEVEQALLDKTKLDAIFQFSKAYY
ncbi:MAG: TolC family protein, partial [Candidatus Omnitrophota bacterium]